MAVSYQNETYDNTEIPKFFQTNFLSCWNIWEFLNIWSQKRQNNKYTLEKQKYDPKKKGSLYTEIQWYLFSITCPNKSL